MLQVSQLSIETPKQVNPTRRLKPSKSSANGCTFLTSSYLKDEQAKVDTRLAELNKLLEQKKKRQEAINKRKEEAGYLPPS